MPTRSRNAKPASSKTKAPAKSKRKSAPKASKTVPEAGSVTAAAKAARAPAPAVTATITRLEPVVSGPALRKKELFDTVARQTGLKRAEVKKVIEATLLSMGRALQDSRDLNLQPFGTVKVNRARKLPDGKVVVARIRQARDLPDEDSMGDAEEAATQPDTAAQ